jgi:hypothetical protein
VFCVTWLEFDMVDVVQEVMSYRDAAEVAAVEALQEASSAEILLRCLRFSALPS